VGREREYEIYNKNDRWKRYGKIVGKVEGRVI
jgi:hypothetical protein